MGYIGFIFAVATVFYLQYNLTLFPPLIMAIPGGNIGSLRLQKKILAAG